MSSQSVRQWSAYLLKHLGFKQIPNDCCSYTPHILHTQFIHHSHYGREREREREREGGRSVGRRGVSQDEVSVSMVMHTLTGLGKCPRSVRVHLPPVDAVSRRRRGRRTRTRTRTRTRGTLIRFLDKSWQQKQVRSSPRRAKTRRGKMKGIKTAGVKMGGEGGITKGYMMMGVRG